MGAREYLHDDDYEFFLKSRNGRCAICHTPIEDLSQNLSVDHNHDTMEVRGLLCQSCNLGLGNFRDSIKNLKNAIVYLTGHTGIYLRDIPITTRANSSSDWRLLSPQDREHVRESSIGSLMLEYGISRATAYNWKNNSSA